MTNTMSPYSQYIHLSRYARWDDTKKRRETWEETIDRYVLFFTKKFDSFPADEIKEAILNLKVMPSMRCLMTAGPALERDHAAGFNCSGIVIDNPRAFDEILYLLMVRYRRSDFQLRGNILPVFQPLMKIFTMLKPLFRFMIQRLVGLQLLDN